MEVNGSTVMWWLAQPEENQERLLKLIRKPLKQALEELFGSFNQHRLNPNNTYIWSHGSNFDTVILENACKLVGVPLWWVYRNIRDTRTLFDACNYTYKSKGGHDALEDAVSQAEAVIAACTQ
jgi:3' exoribonuclease, RNase T-like